MNQKTDAFAGYARGWFVVAFSSELGPGDVQPLEYFGTRLVMWRTEAGDVHVTDAYCPHLGADLAVGGTVVDGAIRCPFHHWRFDGTGRCVDVPYATRIPPKAAIRPWPVRERNGLLFVWHARGDDTEPEWEIPEIPQIADPEWLDWAPNCIRIKTHPREIVENVADKGHFGPVHGTWVDAFDNEFVEHRAVQRTAGVAYPRGGGKDTFSLVATYHGPGYQISEMDGYLKSILLLAHTPVDEQTLDLRFGVSLAVAGPRTAEFAQAYVDNLRTGFHEDIEIWENKVYRDRPVLCDGDGPIGKLRRWYRQFYSG